MRTLGVVAVVVIVAAILIDASVFTVNEREQVIITQFGKPKRAVTEPGLAFRTPFLEKVDRLEKRLLPWDGDPENMPTKDKKRIFIDVWARWKIVDPMQFFRRVRTTRGGQDILDQLVDSAVRDVVGRYHLIECVRTSNDPLEYEDQTLTEGESRDQDRIAAGRIKLEEEMLAAVNGEDLKTQYGMEVVAIHFKRVNYIDNVRARVYERMKSERTRVAKLYESEAEEERNRIMGATRKELDRIEGDKEQRAAEIRGEADAAVINVYANALSKGPKFFEFMRSLDAYKTTLGSKAKLVLSTDNQFLKLLDASDTPD